MVKVPNVCTRSASFTCLFQREGNQHDTLGFRIAENEVICRTANLMQSYLNVYLLLARILDEEGESFLPLWIDGCVTSLKTRINRIYVNITQTQSMTLIFPVNVPCSLW